MQTDALVFNFFMTQPETSKHVMYDAHLLSSLHIEHQKFESTVVPLISLVSITVISLQCHMCPMSSFINCMVNLALKTGKCV